MVCAAKPEAIASWGAEAVASGDEYVNCVSSKLATSF